MKKYIKTVFVLLIIIIMFSGCQKKKDENQILNDKLDSEISYLNDQIIDMTNNLYNIKYNNFGLETYKEKIEKKNTSSESSNSESDSSESGSEKKGDMKQSDDESKSQKENIEKYYLKSSVEDDSNEINWEEFEMKIERIYSSLSIFCLDLKEFGVIEPNLQELRRSIDILSISIENKDKEEVMNNILVAYETITDILKKYNINSEKKDIFQVRYNLLVCLKLAESDKWDELENEMTNLDYNFLNIKNNIENHKGKEININIGTQIIEELKNSVYLHNKKTFEIKYKNLMCQIDML